MQAGGKRTDEDERRSRAEEGGLNKEERRRRQRGFRGVSESQCVQMEEKQTKGGDGVG